MEEGHRGWLPTKYSYITKTFFGVNNGVHIANTTLPRHHKYVLKTKLQRLLLWMMALLILFLQSPISNSRVST